MLPHSYIYGNNTLDHQEEMDEELKVSKHVRIIFQGVYFKLFVTRNIHCEAATEEGKLEHKDSFVSFVAL